MVHHETRIVSRVEVRVLGPLQVVIGGELQALSRPLERRLLKRLAVDPGALVRVDQLVDAMWGEAPPATCDKSLHVHVRAVRRRLEPHRADTEPWRVLVTAPGGYRLDPAAVALDSELFEQELRDARRSLAEDDGEGAAGLLERALGRWRGAAFGASSGAQFALPTAARLETGRLDALELLADAHLRNGHPGFAIARLEQLLERDPLRERGIALLGIAVDRLGDREDARGLLADARRRLDEEVGVAPGRELRDAARRIAGSSGPSTAAALVDGVGRDAVAVTVLLAEAVRLGLDDIDALDELEQRIAAGSLERVVDADGIASVRQPGADE